MSSQTIQSVSVRACLLDIEGTTTPIDFVYRTLFPFARERAADFLAAHHREPQVADTITLLSSEQDRDLADGNAPPPWESSPREAEIKAATRYVHWLMDQDRKSTALKALQGMIWKEGYESGELKGQVYPDVLPALKRWTARGRGVWIFSSGSILAQKLLFGNSNEGDLLAFLSGHFDTTTGPKKAPESYRRIAGEIGLPPAEILFLSDVAGELDAASAAGMQTLLLLRPGNKTQPENTHATAESFETL